MEESQRPQQIYNVSARLDALRSLMAEHGLDAYLILDTTDMRWLTGWEQTFDDGRAHVALITKDGQHLRTDTRYSTIMRTRNAEGDGSWTITDERITHADFIKQYFDHGSLGIDKDIPLNRYRAIHEGLPNVELVELDRLVLQLRAVKDENELVRMRQAQFITDAAFSDLITYIKPGITELDVANEIEYRLRKHGATGMAFQAIAASGTHGASPHAVPTNRRLQDGDFIVMDFGASYRDYCADMTRTVCVGKPTDEQRRIYDATLAAQTAVLEALKPGVTGAEMHQLAADTMDEYGDYSKYFMHALGHGVGLFIHEEPTLAPRVDKPLVPGNVVTVEPGIYVKGLCGVRIEDYGVITQDGFEDFTRSPHRLITLA